MSSKISPAIESAGKKARAKIWTQLEAFAREKDHEVNNQPSETVPGQAMSVLEMLKRHRQGMPVEGMPGGVFTGENLVEDLSKMDLVDRHAYMDMVADALVDVKARIAASAKTKAEKDFLDKVDAAVKEKLAAIGDRNTVTDVKPE